MRKFLMKSTSRTVHCSSPIDNASPVKSVRECKAVCPVTRGEILSALPRMSARLPLHGIIHSWYHPMAKYTASVGALFRRAERF